jgi:hypothetical protein
VSARQRAMAVCSFEPLHPALMRIIQ